MRRAYATSADGDEVSDTVQNEHHSIEIHLDVHPAQQAQPIVSLDQDHYTYSSVMSYVDSITYHPEAQHVRT